MTDEEKAKEWVRTNSGYSTKEFHGQKAIEAFLAGLEAGKSQAETDLATIAYMRGAERHKIKWHKVADEDLPKENAELKEQIEKMKCCENCRHYSHTYEHCYPYDLYQNCKSLSNWRLAEC